MVTGGYSMPKLDVKFEENLRIRLLQSIYFQKVADSALMVAYESKFFEHVIYIQTNQISSQTKDIIKALTIISLVKPSIKKCIRLEHINVNVHKKIPFRCLLSFLLFSGGVVV